MFNTELQNDNMYVLKNTICCGGKSTENPMCNNWFWSDLNVSLTIMFQQISKGSEGQYYIGMTVNLDKSFR